MFLSDNCVQEIKVPKDKVNAFDYSKELNLIASFEYNSELCVLWNPDDGTIIKEIELQSECHCDVLFLPDRFVAVTVDEPHHGCGAYVYSVDSGEEVLYVTYDGASYGDIDVMTLTPDNRLLVGGSFKDFLLDLDNKKVLQSRDIGELSHFVGSMSCSKDFHTICFTRIDDEQGELEEGFCAMSVDFSKDGLVKTSVVEITYCLIENTRREFGFVTGLAFDEELHIIVATTQDIILLESACEGSVGYVIVTSGLPCEVVPLGQILVNHQNRLMVSDGGNCIKVYNFKRRESLQELCRQTINSILKDIKEKVDRLPLPMNVKNYLLYKG